MARKSECKVQCLGFIGNEPTLRYTQEGRPVINLRVLENETWKDASGNKQERTHGHNIVFWGDYAEKVVSKMARKGAYVLVKGDLRYKDIEGQQYDKAAEINGGEFFLLDKGAGRDDANEAPAE